MSILEACRCIVFFFLYLAINSCPVSATAFTAEEVVNLFKRQTYSVPATCPLDPSLINPCTCSNNKTSKNGLPELSCINFNGGRDLIPLDRIFSNLTNYLSSNGESLEFERLLLVNSQTRTINESIFHGLQFRYLSIYETNLTEVSQASFTDMTDTLTYLLIKGDRLTTVFPALQELQSLGILIFNLGLYSFKTIPRHALVNMPALQRVTMNGVANTIESNAFVNLTNLQLLKVTNQVETIEADAFVIRLNGSEIDIDPEPEPTTEYNRFPWEEENDRSNGSSSNGGFDNSTNIANNTSFDPNNFDPNNFGGGGGSGGNNESSGFGNFGTDAPLLTQDSSGRSNNGPNENGNFGSPNNNGFNDNSASNRGGGFNEDANFVPGAGGDQLDQEVNPNEQTEFNSTELDEVTETQAITIDLSNNKLDENSFAVGFIRLEPSLNITLDLTYNWIRYLPEEIFRPFFEVNDANRLFLVNNKFECGRCDSFWIIRNHSEIDIRGRIEVNCYMNSQLTVWNYDWSHCRENDSSTTTTTEGSNGVDGDGSNGAKEVVHPTLTTLLVVQLVALAIRVL